MSGEQAAPGSRIRSPLGFGASGIGTLYRDIPESVATRALASAYQNGIRYFDTAPLYGFGLSELRVGRFLRDLPRESFTLSTKVGRYLAPPYGDKVDYGYWASPLRLKVVFDYSYEGTMRALEQSASRTGLPFFDIVYIHDVDRFTHGADHEKRFDEAMEGCYRALDDLRKGGHVGAVGVGVNESDVATRFVKAGRFDYVMIAGRYTLMDRGAEKDLIPAARERGTLLVAAGVFNSGILAAGPKAARATFDYAPPSAEIRARAQSVADLCAAHGVPLLAAAIQFPLRNPLFAAALLGMVDAEQVRQNVEASRLAIPPALWEEIDAALALAVTP